MAHLPGVDCLNNLAAILEEKPTSLHYDLADMEYIKKSQLEFVKITEGGRIHIMFFDRAFVNENITAKRWYIDSTFAVRPRKCGTQFMTIMMSKNDKVTFGNSS